MSKYYNIEDDFKKYKDAWCYIVVGGNSTGKTYSTLKYLYEKKKVFSFVKRTNDDINMMTTGRDIDLSPFKSINRDIGSNVQSRKVTKGIGAFYDIQEESSEMVGYIMSLNATGTVKGFDASDVTYIVFDEFIPQPWERVDRKEGDKLLVLYRTLSRDREQRGGKPLKLICLANATSINNPIFDILNLTDKVVEMKQKGDTYLYDRGIMVHLLDDNNEFKQKEKETAIMRAMRGTQWESMALDNSFSYNDFTHIQHKSIKGMKCIGAFKRKEKIYYIYKKGIFYHVCKSKSDNVKIYDLSRETDQRAFNNVIIKTYDSLYNNNMTFCDYTSYDIFINYRKYYKI